jgi:hypothetical protein
MTSDQHKKGQARNALQEGGMMCAKKGSGQINLYTNVTSTRNRCGWMKANDENKGEKSIT